jgi:L-ascorbate metabolism protein UlaG (beta-lactamase superfamily)
MFKAIIVLLIFLGLANFSSAKSQFEKDTFQTAEGELKITFIGHGTLMFLFQDKVIHVDSWSDLADYNQLPEADIILLTHEHYDHLDLNAISSTKKKDTSIVLTEACSETIDGGLVLKNGDIKTVKGIKIEAVPAYNVKHKRDNGQPFHPKGMGNGYIINFVDFRVYVAGDTEDIPEMKEIKDIDIAFLPMNLPYTMTPEMVADAAKIIRPKILYPYHYGNTDTNQLIELLRDQKDIEVRIRRMS